MSGGANGTRAGYESARLELARLRLSGDDARAAAMRQIAQTSARALGVERVGIWAFKGTGGGLVGVCQFDLPSGTFPTTGLPDGLALPVLLAEIDAHGRPRRRDPKELPRGARHRVAHGGARHPRREHRRRHLL
jgi:hypothetical protein